MKTKRPSKTTQNLGSESKGDFRRKRRGLERPRSLFSLQALLLDFSSSLPHSLLFHTDRGGTERRAHRQRGSLSKKAEWMEARSLRKGSSPAGVADPEPGGEWEADREPSPAGPFTTLFCPPPRQNPTFFQRVQPPGTGWWVHDKQPALHSVSRPPAPPSRQHEPHLRASGCDQLHFHPSAPQARGQMGLAGGQRPPRAPGSM